MSSERVHTRDKSQYLTYISNLTASPSNPDLQTTFFLLRCLDCDEEYPLPIPFESEEKRGKWAAAHRDGTGHNRWRVWEESRPEGSRECKVATDELEKRWDEATEELRTFVEPILVEIEDQRTASATETEMTPLVRRQQQIRQAAERRLATRYPEELAEIVVELES